MYLVPADKYTLNDIPVKNKYNKSIEYDLLMHFSTIY